MICSYCHGHILSWTIQYEQGAENIDRPFLYLAQFNQVKY